MKQSIQTDFVKHKLKLLFGLGIYLVITLPLYRYEEHLDELF